MKQQTKTKPLYKRLNEERISGEWDNNLHDGNVNCGGMVVANCYSSLVSPQKIKANAQYTALAVNNLHHLAEALEYIINEMESIKDSEITISETLALKKAKEALTRIS